MEARIVFLKFFHMIVFEILPTKLMEKEMEQLLPIVEDFLFLKHQEVELRLLQKLLLMIRLEDLYLQQMEMEMSLLLKIQIFEILKKLLLQKGFQGTLNTIQTIIKPKNLLPKVEVAL